jgi:hypothetical protein
MTLVKWLKDPSCKCWRFRWKHSRPWQANQGGRNVHGSPSSTWRFPWASGCISAPTHQHVSTQSRVCSGKHTWEVVFSGNSWLLTTFAALNYFVSDGLVCSGIEVPSNMVLIYLQLQFNTSMMVLVAAWVVSTYFQISSVSPCILRVLSHWQSSVEHSPA